VIDLPWSPVIDGDGVRLRRWEYTDVDALTAIWQDPELRHRFAVQSTTAATIEIFVRDAGRSWSAGAACMLAVVDPASDEIVGGCDLSDLDGDGPPDVGYWVTAAHRGSGIAVRAVTALLAWARGELHLDTFVLEVEPDNAASIAVARALGFAHDGTERRDRSTTPARTLARYRLDRTS
jgi:RimJ/RimL family protein N-acetyltransferase